MKRARRLDALRVVTPCPVSWSSMRGDDAVRFCDRCRKNVYNVAALGPAEAMALIERAEGRVCMLLTRRSDGTVVTGDCWAQLRRARKRGLVALALAAPVIVATQLWSQGFGLRTLFSLFDRPPARLAGEAVIAPPVAGAPVAPGGVQVLEPEPPRPQPRRLLGKMAPPRHPRQPELEAELLLGQGR
jgi:hypothetical protein